MNMEFLHIVLIVGLMIAIVLMTIAIISTTLYTYRKTKSSKVHNTNKFYTAYPGENTDVILVTFQSTPSSFELMNAIYWAGANNLNLSKVMYLDLDTNIVYRPNAGHFDMCSYYEIEFFKRPGGELIKHIRVRDNKRRSVMEFEYVKKF